MVKIPIKIELLELRRTDGLARRIGISRNAYINKAVRFYSELQERGLLALQLRRESRQVRRESMAVLKEFEALQPL